MLRHSSDVRSIIFILITSGLLVFLWGWGMDLNPVIFGLLYAWQLLMAVVVAVMTHNHQHLSMWRSKVMNLLTDNWLSVFYGFPIFGWIPTHNVNHHRYINKEEDYTRTYRYSEKNNLLTLLTYPSISGYFQQQAIGRYLTRAYKEDKTKFYACLLQIALLVAWVGIALIVDWKKALLFVVIPQQVSLFSVLIFNYLQHIHTDEESDLNNSRNFTGSILNFILLNNGYHTAHHVSAGLHWSQLKAKHKELEPKIDPVLNESNFVWFMFRTYILGLFIPKMSTTSLRLVRLQKE